MPCTVSNLFHIFPGIFGQFTVTEGKTVKSDDRIHRRADLMAHARKECRLRLVGLLGCIQSFSEDTVPVHGVAHFHIYYGESEAYRMDHVLRMTLPRHSDHLVVFFSVPAGKITEYDDKVLRQCLADIVRIDKTAESFTVTLRNGVIRVFREELIIREMNAFRRLVAVQRISPVTDSIVLIKIDVINTPVIRCQRRDHLILLIPVMVLFQKFGIGFLKFLPGILLVRDLALGSSHVTDKEYDDNCCHYETCRSEEGHVVKDHVKERK